MSEFETTASLSVEISTQELRSVRREIENELSDVALGLSPSPNGGGPAGGSGGGVSDPREQRRRRREFRWARQRTGDMEDAVELLDSIDGKVGEGGGGLLGGLADGVTDLGGILPQALATGVGSAVGSAVGDAVSSTELTVEETTLEVEDIDPLEVDDPSPLSVEDTTLSLETTTLDVDAPVLSVEELDPLLVDDPSPLEVEDIPPVQVERPEWMIQVEQPDPISVDVTGRGDSGDGETGPRTISFPDDPEIGVREIGQSAGVGGALGAGAGSFFGPAGTAVGGVAGVAAGGLGGLGAAGIGRAVGGREIEIPGTSRPTSSGGDGGGNGVSTVQVQQDNTVNVDVQNNIDMDRFVDQTVEAFEREIEQVRREIDRDIDRLEREIARATS